MGSSPHANDDAVRPVIVEDDVVGSAYGADPKTVVPLGNHYVAIPRGDTAPPVAPPDDVAVVPGRSHLDAVSAFVKQNWLVLITAAIALGGYLATLKTLTEEVAAINTTVEEQGKDIAALKVEQARQVEATSDIKEIRATAEETARNVAALCQATRANCR